MIHDSKLDAVHLIGASAFQSVRGDFAVKKKVNNIDIGYNGCAEKRV